MHSLSYNLFPVHLNLTSSVSMRGVHILTHLRAHQSRLTLFWTCEPIAQNTGRLPVMSVFQRPTIIISSSFCLTGIEVIEAPAKPNIYSDSHIWHKQRPTYPWVRMMEITHLARLSRTLAMYSFSSTFIHVANGSLPGFKASRDMYYEGCTHFDQPEAP